MLTVYTQPNCPYCEQAKEWLTRNSIDYKVINVIEDNNALNFIKEKGHKSVPQIYLGNDLFVEGGFTGLSRQDPIVLREQLELNELRGLA